MLFFILSYFYKKCLTIPNVCIIIVATDKKKRVDVESKYIKLFRELMVGESE